MNIIFAIILLFLLMLLKYHSFSLGLGVADFINNQNAHVLY